ncbi:DUF6049 family protein [Cellulomonas marina]|uniref:Uncharacterized protein n=1 Tax=Cellulomonas marina TaxID=988821 RepID=A0A1I0YKK2_9CELL|nr:DUF6049 family protein [Cellulomonas marina]GIG28674.1 hypothetical protein Cma02nite_12740 [Cellulomonas marina]SFB12693.1 hypothetical protein SAMN05421867_107171 [Cellulomonas marina]
MTATGARVAPARVPPGGTDGRRRVRTGLLAALVLALLGVLVVPAAGPAAAAGAGALPVTVAVTSVEPAVLRPDVDLVVTASVRNDGDEEVSAPQVSLLLSRFRLGARSEVAAWADAGPDDAAGSRVVAVPLAGPLPPGGSADVTLTLPAEDVRLLDLPDVWGPRGLAVEVTVGRSRLGLARTYVLWQPDGEVARARVAVVVPVVGPAAVADGAAPGTGGDPASGSEDEAQPDSTPDAMSGTQPEAGPGADPDAGHGAETGTETGNQTGTETGTETGDNPGAGTEAGPDADGVAAAATDDLEALTAPEGRLGRLLAATAGQDAVTWAVDPALVAGAAAGGPLARAWATTALDGPAADGWALPWGDPDAAALAHAARGGLLGVATALGAEAAATTGAGGAGDVVWTAGAADDATVAAAAAAGADVLVVDDPGAATAGGLATATTAQGDLVVATPDPLLTALLVEGRAPDGAAEVAGSTGTGPTPTPTPSTSTSTSTIVGTDDEDAAAGAPATTATARQRLLAETAVAARTAAGDRLLIAPGRDWEPQEERTAVLLAALADAPWVTTTDLAGLVAGGDDSPAADLPGRVVDEDETDPDDVRALADARAAARSFAAVASDPDALLAGVDATTLLPLSVAWRADPAGRDAAVAAALEALRGRAAGLSVAPVSTVNVVSAQSELRLSVRSALPADATVRLRVDPDRACLAADRSPTVTVPAGAEVAVPVHLVATANCDVTVRVSLTTADGIPVGEPVAFEARVSPTIESVGVVVVGALLAVFLVVGIVRTVRRGQSSTRGAGSGAEPGSLGVLGGRGTDTGAHPVVPDPSTTDDVPADRGTRP